MEVKGHGKKCLSFNPVGRYLSGLADCYLGVVC